jgi:CelD/BcsL family acetyltransferase involved in cellulose biosynthesis
VNAGTLPVKQQAALNVQVYSAWKDLADLRPAWEALLRDSRAPSIFTTPEWLGAWWNAFGRNKELFTLTFWHPDGDLVGLAPLYLDTLLGIRRLRFVGDGSWDSNNLDVTARPGQAAACAQALLAWLDSGSWWDVCALNTLPADSPSLDPLLDGLRERQWACRVYPRPNAVLTLPTTWETYLRQLPRSRLRDIKYRSRRVRKRYNVRLLKCATVEDLPTYLDALFDLHQRRWTAQGEPGRFSMPERRQFYAEMSHAFLRRGWLEFFLLELDGKIVAADLAVRDGVTVHGLQAGRDPAYDAEGVGMVLMIHVIEQCIAEGVHRVDFAHGDEAYKFGWGAQPGTYTDAHFARPLTRGDLYLCVERGVKPAKRWLKHQLRAHAPRSAYSAVGKLYRALWPQ